MMKRSMFVLLGATALCLSGCGKKEEANVATADAGNSMAAATPAAALSPEQAFANVAASSDAFEIATSQLALQKSASASVKKFAQQMVTAHTQSTAKLNAATAAAAPAIVADPTLTEAQQARLDTLKNATGAAFDTAYIAEQRTAHEAALTTLRDYSLNGSVPSLKAFATEVVPTVAAHLNMAKGLKP